MKDPAFLFYPGDYLRDTQNLSEKTQVAYDRIMCEHMRNICISKQQLKFFTKRLSEDEIDELMLMLTVVDNGYQIEWVAESISKRKAYSESRRQNRVSKTIGDKKNISLSYDKHMENENEIVNEVISKGIDIKEREIQFIAECDKQNILTGDDLKKFILYWTESSGIKLRFEKEKTWDIVKRMQRWVLNNKEWSHTKTEPVKPSKHIDIRG